MNRSSRSSKKFVVCVRNDGYPEALELRKLYEVVPDRKAARTESIRVIDESGEDYLYPTAFFAEVSLVPAVIRALVAA